MADHDAGDLHGRLERLEEHHAFADRAAERAREDFDAINRAIRDLATRIDRLERRLDSLAEPAAEPETDPPPEDPHTT